ncbi:MAG: discoidin domain-containing protein, partial [Oscillospiraceae bacterium]|nr:discoidin domain-containing protein [Oscillospiraceae bacterium]
EIQIDETGDRYYLIETDDEITAVFSLTLIDKISISADRTHAHNGDTVKFTAVCEPEGTSGVTWEVLPMTGLAEIDENGIFTAKSKGVARVRAKALAGEADSDWMEIVMLGGLNELNKLTSDDYTVFGRTEGKWETGDPPANAFDGKANTAYDGQDGGYCGIELAEPAKIAAFRYMPRYDNERRMPGTVFQVSNDGVNYITIYTVPEPGSYGTYVNVYVDDLSEEAMTLLQNNEYKYFRFHSGDAGFSNIAEIEVYTGRQGMPSDVRITGLS